VRSVQQVVPGAVAALLRSAPLSAGKVAFAWTTAVGPALERVTSVRLEGRTLVVVADSKQWAREIGRSSGMILPRLQTLLGSNVVTELRVQARAR
jgi:predicted nucleic acid-binding Zn ribbon protein